MYLLKLRQIKLLRNMIMPLSTSRLTFIKVRVWPHIQRLNFPSQVVGVSSFFSFCSVDPFGFFYEVFCFMVGSADVPEGCVIIREHVPISNLFTCLWYNEVDRFTSRDQISFSTVRDKIISKTNWSINMFLDCERRNFVVQVIYFMHLLFIKVQQMCTGNWSGSLNQKWQWIVALGIISWFPNTNPIPLLMTFFQQLNSFLWCCASCISKCYL
jgi:hypothetical protein